MDRENEKPAEHEDLLFRPIDKGLGFHPFSDGLPYAPRSHAHMRRAAGASAAGTPEYNSRAALTSATAGAPAVKPRPLPSSAHTPRSPMVPEPLRPQPALSKNVPKSVPYRRPAPWERMEAEEKERKLRPDLSEKPGWIYLSKRFFAYLFDSFLNLALCATALGLAIWRLNIPPEQLMSSEIVVGSLLFLVLFNWSVITAQEIAFGASVGKRIMGLNLEGNAAAIFVRSFFFVIGMLFAGLGVIWALFDPKRRCLHDIISDVQPRELARL